MDVIYIKAENSRLKIENVRLTTQLREAQELIQLFERDTRPHSAPLAIPPRNRLFSYGSVSPDRKSFSNQYRDNTGHKGSI